jgi:predicted small lipoprotein YifL
LRIVLALLVLAMVGGCGRKGPPTPPGPPDQIIYPKLYPAAPT